MTNKERLEKLKSNRCMYGKEGCKWFATEINIDDFDWLIEQAEKVEELKSDIEFLKSLKAKESRDRAYTYQTLTFVESLSKKQLTKLISENDGNPNLKEMLCKKADETGQGHLKGFKKGDIIEDCGVLYEVEENHGHCGTVYGVDSKYQRTGSRVVNFHWNKDCKLIK